MERKYSNIFSLLVRNQSDIVGHIAYALYKSEKANYIEHFCAINNRKPTDDELSIFHDISSQPDSVNEYRFVASNILSRFIDNSLQESIQGIERSCYARHADILKDVIKPLRPPKKRISFLHGVAQSIAGAFIFALIVAAFMFIISYKGAEVPFVIIQR